MTALRFFVFGYLAAALAGLFIGASEGALAGFLTAWLGGGIFSLALAALAWSARLSAEARPVRATYPLRGAARRDAV